MINSTRTRSIRPASEKQINLIKKVMGEKDLPAALARDLSEALEEGLNIREASRFIDALFALPRKPRAPKADVAEGYYTNGTDIAKVQMNLAGTNKYAKRLVIEQDGEFRLHPDEDFDQEDYDAWRRQASSGSWNYEAGLIREIGNGSPWRPLTAEEAEAFGRLYGVCGICGRRLTNEESIERGIGPVCFGKVFG